MWSLFLVEPFLCRRLRKDLKKVLFFSHFSKNFIPPSNSRKKSMLGHMCTFQIMSTSEHIGKFGNSIYAVRPLNFRLINCLLCSKSRVPLLQSSGQLFSKSNPVFEDKRRKECICDGKPNVTQEIFSPF